MASPGAGAEEKPPSSRRTPDPTACPSCGTSGGLAVLTGSTARCVVCGTERSPLRSTVVNVAGRPARAGGLALRIAGVGVGAVGALFGILVGLLVGWLSSSSVAALAVAIPIVLVALGAGALLAIGGGKLKSRGEDAGQLARERAIFALAAHRGGRLDAEEVASNLRVSIVEAEEMLTALAHRGDGRTQLEVDEAGRIYFAFPTLEGRPSFAAPRLRFGDFDARLERAQGLADPEAEAEREAMAETEAAPSLRRSS